MGKNNKIACIHITRNDVRIVEGRVSSGVILISHSAIVQKAGRFFSGDRLANMSDLVSDDEQYHGKGTVHRLR